MRRAGTVAAAGALLLALAVSAPREARAQGTPGQKPDAQTVNRSVETIRNPAPDLRAQAQAAIEKKDYTSAAQLLTKYVAAEPKDPIGHFELGYAYTALDSHNNAQTQLKNAQDAIARGVAGIVMGVAASEVVSLVIGWPTPIAPSAIIGGFPFSLALGIFFGSYPARKAARLDPITAAR